MIEIKRPHHALLIALMATGLLPTTGFAKSKPITPQDLFINLSPTEPWRKGELTAAKTVNFNQTASGGTDATTVLKVQLGYFTSADCTGAKAGGAFYTTPDGTSFTISVGTPFGLVAASAWSVGVNQLGISTGDMANIQSVAITLKSTNSDVPQSNFSNNSFACVAVSCATDACTLASGSSTQNFVLKTTAAVGDPADGGKIADTNGLIATASDDSTGIDWSQGRDTIGASSNTAGAANTTTIVGNTSCSNNPANCAANLCNTLSIAGGYTSGSWFLPAKNQLLTLFTNKGDIGNFTTNNYWSSSELNTNNASYTNFDTGGQPGINKGNSFHVRCTRAFTP
ncbi:MAG: DUF1566 domain-containing protein [Legionellaceae bacterium]|nr:DUF1566 domain-containing protein [Legionellaceae bacterium]